MCPADRLLCGTGSRSKDTKAVGGSLKSQQLGWASTRHTERSKAVTSPLLVEATIQVIPRSRVMLRSCSVPLTNRPKSSVGCAREPTWNHVLVKFRQAHTESGWNLHPLMDTPLRKRG